MTTSEKAKMVAAYNMKREIVDKIKELNEFLGVESLHLAPTSAYDGARFYTKEEAEKCLFENGYEDIGNDVWIRKASMLKIKYIFGTTEDGCKYVIEE